MAIVAPSPKRRGAAFKVRREVSKMSFTDVLNDIMVAWRHQRRIKNDKQAIQTAMKRLDENLDQISREVDDAGHSANMFSGEGMDGWDGNAIAIFKEHMGDPELHRLFQTYPDLMQRMLAIIS